jgi:hypothetical protein
VSDIELSAKPLVSHRTAKWIVGILSALIILAVIGLVVGFIWQLTHGSPATPGRPYAGQAFVLPKGAKIDRMETQNGRLILLVRAPEGDEIDIVSTEDGRLIAQVKAVQ